DTAAGRAGGTVLHLGAVALDLARGGSAAGDRAAGGARTLGRTPALRTVDVARAVTLALDRRSGVQRELAVAAAGAGHLTVHAGGEGALAGAGAAPEGVF